MNPGDWQRKTCAIHGVGSEVYISVRIATHIPNPPNDGTADFAYPFTETDLCLKCWSEHGIAAAITHNEEIRNEMDAKG